MYWSICSLEEVTSIPPSLYFSIFSLFLLLHKRRFSTEQSQTFRGKYLSVFEWGKKIPVEHYVIYAKERKRSRGGNCFLAQNFSKDIIHKEVPFLIRLPNRIASLSSHLLKLVHLVTHFYLQELKKKSVKFFSACLLKLFPCLSSWNDFSFLGSEHFIRINFLRLEIFWNS
jgi:hypothetical protein